jgi:glutamate/tyrosine decarboxylase-like PLP-dependent enzyme
MDGSRMSARAVLDAAHNLAVTYLDGISGRHVGGSATTASLRAALGGPLPQGPADPVTVLRELASQADRGIVASAGPRYFGFVTGGAMPVCVAADWLASAWDQNGALYVMSPAVAVLEDIVARWLVELLGLPSPSSIGFVTGCHMANFTCLAAARHEVLRRAGWNVEADGLQRAPKITVFVGDEVHISAVGGLRLLGFGTDELVRIPVDGQGRMQAQALKGAMAGLPGPAIVCAQAGNVNTGASDPFHAIVEIAHSHDAWVHVDGAFGLWAAAVPELRAEVSGVERANSWATDAHKWLNVPYDSGLVFCRDGAQLRGAMRPPTAAYLTEGEHREPDQWVPEFSRRARGIEVWAALLSLGRAGLRDLVERTCAHARRFADGLRKDGHAILNDVVVSFGEPERTRRVIDEVQRGGELWCSGTVSQGQTAMRISVSSWATTAADVERSLAGVRAAVARVR